MPLTFPDANLGQLVVGMQATQAANGEPTTGAFFQSIVDRHNLQGSDPNDPEKGLLFIQNQGWAGKPAIENGQQGPGGAAGGFVSLVNGNQVVVNPRFVDPATNNPVNGPILDKPEQTVPPPPDYASNSKFAGADRLSISAGDSPGPRLDNFFLAMKPNRVAIVQGLTDIAVRYNFRIYLTWRYPPRGPLNQTVTYTIATLDWTVFFRGTVAQPILAFQNAELPHILGAFDVTNHSNPVVTGPTANLSFQAR